MVNETELQFISKIFEDNILFLKTKIKMDTLTDPFAKVMFFEIGKAMRDYGEMIPSKHLKSLIEDEERISRYSKLNYPLELTSVSNVVDYIKSYNSDIKFATLEKTILDTYRKKGPLVLAALF